MVKNEIRLFIAFFNESLFPFLSNMQFLGGIVQWIHLDHFHYVILYFHFTNS